MTLDDRDRLYTFQFGLEVSKTSVKFLFMIVSVIIIKNYSPLNVL